MKTNSRHSLTLWNNDGTSDLVWCNPVDELWYANHMSVKGDTLDVLGPFRSKEAAIDAVMTNLCGE